MSATYKTLGIVNANRLSVDECTGGGPNVRSTIYGMFHRISLAKVTKSIVDFEVKEVVCPLETLGVIQPLSEQELKMKPEGQRAWTWKQIHATPDLVLIPDEIIQYRGEQYRIESKKDFKEYGYVRYHCVKNYSNAPRI